MANGAPFWVILNEHHEFGASSMHTAPLLNTTSSAWLAGWLARSLTRSLVCGQAGSHAHTEKRAGTYVR